MTIDSNITRPLTMCILINQCYSNKSSNGNNLQGYTTKNYYLQKYEYRPTAQNVHNGPGAHDAENY